MLDPTRPLNDAGFRFACGVMLRRHWPEISLKDAIRDMTGFAGVPVGTPGYDWSVNGAKELARLYVEEFGEVGQ